jgi:drug/metabolite transporter (DMT)-like permease
MAVFSTLLGQLVINWVLKWLGPTTVSVGILSEVIWAILLSILLINETLEFKQLIGVIIIFMGLTFYIMNHNYKNQK